MNYRAFIGPSYTSQSSVADAERCVNFYVEMMESEGAKVPKGLYPTPGSDLFIQLSTLGATRGRGMLALNTEQVYLVAGPRLLRLTAPGGVITEGNLGVVIDDGKPATLHSNGDVADQLFITSGRSGYLFNTSTSTFSAIAALADDADMGAYLDGYFISLNALTSTFRLSDLANGAVWSALQAQQRNVATDRWVSMLVANRELWLFGQLTSDVWYNAGTQPFPFQPIPGATLEWGIAAPFSAAILGSPVWLAQNKDGNGMVMQASGYAAKRISNHAVETAIQSYSVINDAIGWTYQQQGHSFYVLTFPTANRTWAYDASTRQWHERMYWNTGTAQEEAWRQQFHVSAFNRHLTLDRASSAVFSLSLSTGIDVGGAAIRRIRQAPHVQWQDRPRVFISHLELDLENGLGLSAGQGSDPTVMLQVSRDGCRTWGPERWTSAGPQGAYTPRVDWTRLGNARDWGFRVMVSDPIPWRILNATLRARMGGAA